MITKMGEVFTLSACIQFVISLTFFVGRIASGMPIGQALEKFVIAFALGIFASLIIAWGYAFLINWLDK